MIRLRKSFRFIIFLVFFSAERGCYSSFITRNSKVQTGFAGVKSDSSSLLPAQSESSSSFLSEDFHITLNSKPFVTPTPNSEKLSEALDELNFDKSILPLFDFGYYGWMPLAAVPAGSYKDLSDVTADDIRACIDLEGLPDTLVDLDEIKLTLPRNFTKLEKQVVKNRFPFGQNAIASLHVASEHRGLDLRDVDFLFGSYSSYILATGKISNGEKCIVARVPGAPNILYVTRYKMYTQNYAMAGSQFERLVLTGDVHPPYKFDNTVHVHMMEIADCNVLFGGEVDACDHDGMPMEIKCASPFKRTVRTLFQMISTASLKICRGDIRFHRKQLPQLVGIHSESIQDYGARIKRRTLKNMSRLLCRRVSWLKYRCDRYLKQDEVMELEFTDDPLSGGMRIKMVPSNVTIRDLFPNQTVLENLLNTEG